MLGKPKNLSLLSDAKHNHREQMQPVLETERVLRNGGITMKSFAVLMLVLGQAIAAGQTIDQLQNAHGY
jgi:hypothetical protein